MLIISIEGTEFLNIVFDIIKVSTEADKLNPWTLPAQELRRVRAKCELEEFEHIWFVRIDTMRQLYMFSAKICCVRRAYRCGGHAEGSPDPSGAPTCATIIARTSASAGLQILFVDAA